MRDDADRKDDARFRDDAVVAFDVLVRPFWPLRYRPKRPRMDALPRKRGWLGRRRWEPVHSVVRLRADER